MLSPSDTAIVFVLALLLFGPEQLPKIARQLGEVMRHVQSTTHTFMQEMERAAESTEPQITPQAYTPPEMHTEIEKTAQIDQISEHPAAEPIEAPPASTEKSLHEES